jgi:hypothetical protein
MTDRRHADDNAKVRAIVDDAIAELYLLGMESRDEAARLMACQAILRIDDNDERKKVVTFAEESVWDVDDTDEGGGGIMKTSELRSPGPPAPSLIINRNISARA